MELKWINKERKSIGLAYVTDDDARVLEFVGYYHCEEEDLEEDLTEEEYIEVWKKAE